MSLHRSSPDTILAGRQRGTLLLLGESESPGSTHGSYGGNTLLSAGGDESPVPNSASPTQSWQEWMEIWVPHYRLVRVEVYVHHLTFAGMNKERPTVLSVVFDWCREVIF